MKAKELIEKLRQGGNAPDSTCDTVKAGDPETELKKVAVSMFATVDIVRAATEWGADMLIVHEPTYYDHHDRIKESPIILEKKNFIEESGLVIYRHHDYIHSQPMDDIAEGEIRYLKLKGNLERTQYGGTCIFTLKEPMTALELANHIEKELHLVHLRIAGTRNIKSTKIATCFGTPAGRFEMLTDENIEIVLTGEACEWQLGEIARDADALGRNKTLIVMGHIGSERDGMRLFAEQMQEKYTDFETHYFECGELYTYTDTVE